MIQRFPKFLVLLFAMVCISAIASADQIAVGDLSYDAISSSTSQFDITNLTGLSSFPPDFPITSLLTFSVTSLVVDFTSGPSLALPGSDFTVVDADGDLDCTGTGCNLFGDNITSATLTGTLSPTSGLSGLPSGDTGIEAAFTTTITPDPVNCTGGTLAAGCDTAIIYATGISPVSGIPEPKGWALCLVTIGFGLALRAVVGWWQRRVQLQRGNA
jgi:hypothetical protein